MYLASGSEGLSLSLAAEIALIVVTFLLAIATIGLWYATAKLHNDEMKKMTDAMSHDNDNMKEIASEINDSNREMIREKRRRNLRRLSHGTIHHN